MCYKYRVYHNEKNKSKIDAFLAPFNEEQERHEYEHFPTALRLHYSGTSTEASSILAEPETDGVVVTLVTNCPEHEADSFLEQLLRKQNNAIPGLCLVMDKIGS
jgi:hypothetical protein